MTQLLRVIFDSVSLTLTHAYGDIVNTIPASVTLAANITEGEQGIKATIVVTEESQNITCMGSSCSKDALKVAQHAEMTRIYNLTNSGESNLQSDLHSPVRMT